MHAFGYRILVTVLLPGTILSATVWLLLTKLAGGSATYALLLRTSSHEWSALLLLILASGFLGTFLAAVADWLELGILDVRRMKERGLDPRVEAEANVYREEWRRYVDSLRDGQNPYWSEVFLYFYFEWRTALAALALIVALPVWNPGRTEILVALVMLAFSLLLFRAANLDHKLMADDRKRRFHKAEPTV